MVNESSFINIFLTRPNDMFWKTVLCILTNVKAKIGCGKPIIVKFYAPLNGEDPSAEIDFEYRGIPDQKGPEQSLESFEQQYALKQSLKLAYYVQKVYQHEILKMRVEFLKDENDKIWFFYASKLSVRCVKNNNPFMTPFGGAK